jgi:pilus assembly protein CpaD
MLIRMTRPAAAAIALTLGLGLSACADAPTNRSLNSIKQPVVTSENYTLDLRASGGEMSIPEQRRLAEWFRTMDLRYGDRVSIDDPVEAPGTREAVTDLAARHGILVSDGAPVTPGYVEPGIIRVVITRSKAEVPGCPDWSGKMSGNYNNATHDGYGCAVNSNLAAMIANPDHLVNGEEADDETYVSRGNRAINTYRNSNAGGNN